MSNISIKLTSESKGSNPGAKCDVEIFGIMSCFYLKYCPGSKLHKRSPYKSVHQPLYEALTFKLSEFLGLNIPDIYVIDNRNLNLNFENNIFKKKLSESLNYYFISKLVENPFLSEEKEKKLDELVKYESTVSNLLLIDDVVGKRQNYGFYADRPIYFDLGCSFVRATSGFLYQKNQKRYNVSSKELKQTLKKLDHYYVRNLNSNLLTKLSELINHIPETQIPLLDLKGHLKKEKISSLISSSELDEIISSHIMNFFELSKKYCKNEKKDSNSLIFKK